VDALGLLTWLTNATPLVTDADCEVNSGSVADGCWGKRIDLLTSGNAAGAVDFYDNGTNKPGDDRYSVYDPIVGETIEKERFGEAAINLTEGLGGTPEECKVSARDFVKSRAARSSFTSEMKDFIGPVPVQSGTCETVTNTAYAQGSNTVVTSHQGAFFTLQ
jgi:hypothetical protein